MSLKVTKVKWYPIMWILEWIFLSPWISNRFYHHLFMQINIFGKMCQTTKLYLFPSMQHFQNIKTFSKYILMIKEIDHVKDPATCCPRLLSPLKFCGSVGCLCCFCPASSCSWVACRHGFKVWGFNPSVMWPGHPSNGRARLRFQPRRRE